jgi:hypothetical protein
MLVFVLRASLEIDCNHVTRYTTISLRNPSAYVYMFVFLRFLMIMLLFYIGKSKKCVADMGGGAGKRLGVFCRKIYISN